MAETNLFSTSPCLAMHCASSFPHTIGQPSLLETVNRRPTPRLERNDSRSLPDRADELHNRTVRNGRVHRRRVMASLVASAPAVSARVLEHLIRRLDRTPVLHEPFSHFYLEEALPADVYGQLLRHLPDPALYTGSAERYHDQEEGSYVRLMFKLTPDALTALPLVQQELWRGIAAALTAPELKRAVFTKLGRDLAYRYGVPESRT